MEHTLGRRPALFLLWATFPAAAPNFRLNTAPAFSQAHALEEEYTAFQMSDCSTFLAPQSSFKSRMSCWPSAKGFEAV